VKELRDAADRVGGYAMMMTRAADYVDAMRARVAMRAELDALLSRYDALLAPSHAARPADRARLRRAHAGHAARAGARARRAPTTGHNSRGEPRGPSRDRVPMGSARPAADSLQLLGRAFSEDTLLALAVAYQEMTTGHRQRP